MADVLPTEPDPISSTGTDPAADRAAGQQVDERVTLDGEPDEVWDLLTDPDYVVDWLGQPVELDLARPGAGRLIDLDGTEREVRVVESAPGRALRWHWWPVDHDDEVSTVEITLLPVGPGTDVRVVETTARASAGTAAWAWSGARFVDVELALLVSRSLVASLARR
jgi:uncharacterized protein YndB with AHSA1/START domain